MDGIIPSLISRIFANIILLVAAAASPGCNSERESEGETSVCAYPENGHCFTGGAIGSHVVCVEAEDAPFACSFATLHEGPCPEETSDGPKVGGCWDKTFKRVQWHYGLNTQS